MTEETSAGTSQTAAALLGGELAPTAPAGGPVDTSAEGAPDTFKGGEYPATFEGGEYPSPFGTGDDPLAPGQPEDFDMPQFIGENEEVTAAHFEFEQWHRNMLAAAELPASIGSALLDEIGTTNNAYRLMSDAERQIWAREQEAQLQRVFPNDYEQKIDIARQLVDEIETKVPGFKDYLEISGAGSSTFVVGMLATHAERLAARKEANRA